MPSGRRAHIRISKETTFGTPVATGDYFRFQSEDLFPDIEEVTPPNILGVPFRGPTYQGLKTYQGPLTFDAHPNILGFFLLSALGPVTTVETEMGVRWTHTFAARTTEFAAACWLQPMTLEIHKDIGQAFQFAGAVANELEVDFGVDAKVLFARAGIIAKTMARITATTPTFEATQAFRWNQAAITLPDPTAFATLQRLRFVINNQQEGLPFIDGTTEIARIRGGNEPTVINVTGRMLAADAEVTEYLTGTERFLKCVWTGPVLGAGNYQFTAEFPKFRYIRHRVSIASPGEVFVDFEGEAKYDPGTANTPMRAILVNSKNGY